MASRAAAAGRGFWAVDAEQGAPGMRVAAAISITYIDAEPARLASPLSVLLLVRGCSVCRLWARSCRLESLSLTMGVGLMLRLLQMQSGGKAERRPCGCAR